MAKAENIVTSVKVEINAPAELVWEILTDFAQYGTWNRFCPGFETTGKLGDPVYMQVRMPGAEDTFLVTEYLIAYEPCRLLSWEQRPIETNKDAARRDQYIESIDAERCTYFTTDIFLGVNADTIMREHGAWVKVGFDQIAHDLKKHAEALYAAR
ncbi:MAG: SRPBCC domain-containing protein [Pseudomonas sp.]